MCVLIELKHIYEKKKMLKIQFSYEKLIETNENGHEL